MSRNYARRYRVAHVPTSARPWIVQASLERRADWADIARFHEEKDAHTYANRILGHQFHHLETTHR